MIDEERKPRTRGTVPWVQLGLATGFGSGYSPVAPGTAGTLIAVGLFIPFAKLAAASPWQYLITLVGLTAIAVWSAERADRYFESHDDPRVVIDEIVGYFVALTGVPYGWQTALGAFVLFRFFDILKPPPVRLLERRLPGGYGVVGDDIMAGLYANLVLQLLVRGGWLA